MSLIVVAALAACAPPTPQPPHALLNGTWLISCPTWDYSADKRASYTIDFDRNEIVVSLEGAEVKRSTIKLTSEEPDKVVFKWEGLIEADQVTAVFENRDRVQFIVPGRYCLYGDRAR